MHARMYGYFTNYNTYDTGRGGALAMHGVNPDDAGVFYTGACLRIHMIVTIGIKLGRQAVTAD